MGALSSLSPLRPIFKSWGSVTFPFSIKVNPWFIYNRHVIRKRMRVISFWYRCPNVNNQKRFLKVSSSFSLYRAGLKSTHFTYIHGVLPALTYPREGWIMFHLYVCVHLPVGRNPKYNLFVVTCTRWRSVGATLYWIWRS